MIDVNADAVVKFTARLERAGRSAFPNAVQNTLSKAAFDVKGNTMPAEAKRAFAQRKPTFFKAASTVQPARGKNIATMRAVVGFRDIPNDKGDAVKDLEKQEEGGRIGGRTFVALKGARAAKNWHRLVSRNLRMDALNEAFDANNGNLKGKNEKENFTISAIYAKKGGLVMGTRKNKHSNRTVFKINSVKRKGRRTVVNSTPVYSMRKGRKAAVEATHFMRRAAGMTVRKMEQIYEQEARKQLGRAGVKV